MKKHFLQLLTCALTASLLFALAASTAALYTSRQDVIVLQNTPTLDGVIREGEWDEATAIDLTADNCALWEGSAINNEVRFYYSWDDVGLYIAANVVDNDLVICRGTEDVFYNDAFQIALDPGGLLAKGGESGGMFFSVGPASSGALAAVYHPYGGNPQSFTYEGKYSITDDGWQFEMVIPWISIEILYDDGYEWAHRSGEFMNAILCMLDRDNNAANTIAYKTALEKAPKSFRPADYALKLGLYTAEDAPADTTIAEEDTVPAEGSETVEVTENTEDTTEEEITDGTEAVDTAASTEAEATEAPTEVTEPTQIAPDTSEAAVTTPEGSGNTPLIIAIVAVAAVVAAIVVVIIVKKRKA